MNTDVVVIGAGQAGLAASALLSRSGVDHVVLERGGVAHSWRTERWDSLRLLTPNWMTRLPGHRYTGTNPDGYMSANDVARFLAAYCRRSRVPLITGAAVDSLAPGGRGFDVAAVGERWSCRAVVVATGAASTPSVPAIAAALPARLTQVTSLAYRNAEQLRDGPVLVVGASASGVQIADELARSGREVVLSVGDHIRVPRCYRGRDIHHWLDAVGVLDERIDDVPDPRRARRLPSLQLVGSSPQRDIDATTLAALGVQMVGRLVGVAGSSLQFAGSIANMVTAADLKQNRLLDRVDAYITRHDLDSAVGPPARPEPVRIERAATTLDVRRFATVVWATGFRRHHPWAHHSLVDASGAIVHDRGVGAAPGLFVLGELFQRRRKSAFIDGVGTDAAELVPQLVECITRPSRTPGSRCGLRGAQRAPVIVEST
ncbi:MAG: FAD-dependent oxidoreductase [Actinomycetota bacterium]